LALALLLLCAACGKKEQTEGAYDLYFVSAAQHGYGSALATEPYTGDGEPDPSKLLTALLAGPSDEGLASPFPQGTALRSWSRGPEEGRLRVYLTEQYSGLADIALTLADYSIVLTLTQLDGVDEVEIISDGHTANYRSHSLLRAEEAVLTD
jgi:spore germination protein GerM